MDEPELTTLREQAAQGSRDALDQLVELEPSAATWTSCAVWPMAAAPTPWMS
jgi:hypothetical protein